MTAATKLGDLALFSNFEYLLFVLYFLTADLQVIVGSFVYGGSKTKNKTKTGRKTGHESELPVGDKQQSTPTSSVLNQNLTPSSAMGGWAGSRQMEMRSAHIDIDLTRG